MKKPHSSLTIKQKALKEFKVVGLVTVGFAVWFVLLILIKTLLLAEYNIEYRGLTIALVGALITAKVVVALDHVSLGAAIRQKPAVIEIILRSLVYTVGVLIVLLIEKLFDIRHEAGGVYEAAQSLFLQRDIHHVTIKTIAVGLSMFIYNVCSILIRDIGPDRLRKTFFAARG